MAVKINQLLLYPKKVNKSHKHNMKKKSESKEICPVIVYCIQFEDR